MSGINWGNNGLLANFSYMQQPPVMSVIRVSGINGADAFQMGPNSSALLLDETEPIVWLVQTDGAGYKTKTPYDIIPHKAEPSPEIKEMDERFASIDQRLKAIEEAMLDEPNT